MPVCAMPSEPTSASSGRDRPARSSPGWRRWRPRSMPSPKSVFSSTSSRSSSSSQPSSKDLTTAAGRAPRKASRPVLPLVGNRRPSGTATDDDDQYDDGDDYPRLILASRTARASEEEGESRASMGSSIDDMPLDGRPHVCGAAASDPDTAPLLVEHYQDDDDNYNSGGGETGYPPSKWSVRTRRRLGQMFRSSSSLSSSSSSSSSHRRHKSGVDDAPREPLRKVIKARAKKEEQEKEEEAKRRSDVMRYGVFLNDTSYYLATGLGCCLPELPSAVEMVPQGYPMRLF